MTEPLPAANASPGYVPARRRERHPRLTYRAVGPADPDEHVRVVIKVRTKNELSSVSA